MDTGVLILIIILSVIFGFILLFVCLAFICDHIAFGHRCEKNPLLKYFTAEDFELTAKPVSVPFKKIKLGGYIYNKNGVEKREKLIIFCHGMGPGQVAYTTEIAYFCNQGYTVLALDNMGCNLSGGKKIRGMYSGAEAAISAVKFAQTDSELKRLKPYLVGHSWGGYSALCASAKVRVEGVVAISAPNSPAATVAHAVADRTPEFFHIFLFPVMFYLYLIMGWKYLKQGGLMGDTDAKKCVKESGTPTLLIHGDEDTVVDKDNSVFHVASGYNVTKYLAEGKGHNPYNTPEAEQKLADLSTAFKIAKKTGKNELLAFLDSFDYSAATEEDETVMQEIIKFIEK